MGKDPKEYPENDRQLLDKVAAGDEMAYRHLVELCWARVYFNTLTLVKSPTVAQELTQDILLKLWLQRDKLATVENLRTWLFVIGRHQVVSALRKKIIETVSLDPNNEQDLQDLQNLQDLRHLQDLHLPHLEVERKDIYAIILQGVARLTPQQQTIFKMSRLEGLSHDEIAKRLQLSKNTIKVHIVAALNTLRTWLREHSDYGLILGPLVPLLALLAVIGPLKKYF
jgi:RNA polymerase sigma factor (sigma-70 family)